MSAERCLRCPIPPALTCRGMDVRRFCDLLDPAEPRFDPGYERVLWTFARPLADEPPRPSPAEALRLLAAVRSCAYRSPPVASCGCARCALAGGAERGAAECLECVRRYDAPANSTNSTGQNVG